MGFSDLGPSYFAVRKTPNPILFRSRSGNLSRAFSACSFVLKGFDSGTNSRPTYSNRNHRDSGVVLPIGSLTNLSRSANH